LGQENLDEGQPGHPLDTSPLKSFFPKPRSIAFVSETVNQDDLGFGVVRSSISLVNGELSFFFSSTD
jgi:hypothetical protein